VACASDEAPVTAVEYGTIIHTDRTNLKKNLEKAHNESLISGKSVTVRLEPQSDSRLLQEDQEYVRKIIHDTYGPDALISFETESL
jgi:hypothetical protein